MSEFSFEDIVTATKMVNKDNRTPEKIYLGTVETKEIIRDANFASTANAAFNSATKLGTVAGMDVYKRNIEHCRIITTEDEDAYYLF